MVASNPLLYEPEEHPDHVVVIKCIPLLFLPVFHSSYPIPPPGPLALALSGFKSSISQLSQEVDLSTGAHFGVHWLDSSADVPYVADSKRAMDEYTSEIFMGGKNTIAMHNTCEDSLLATPLIIDLGKPATRPIADLHRRNSTCCLLCLVFV